jgi:cytoskeletal protein CcmA (bactofilin family)
MADVVTLIGRTSFVRGRVSGSGSLEIAGRVEGEVSVTGDLTVDATGLCAANITARRLTVRGAVKGDLSATDAIVLEAGARVVGDINAPHVAIAEGALVRGHVQTGAGGAAAQKRAPAGASRTTPHIASRVEPRAHASGNANAKAPPPLPVPVKKAPPPPPASSSSRNQMPRGSVLAGTRPKAPAPIVPVLKKGAKATQKKRA